VADVKLVRRDDFTSLRDRIASAIYEAESNFNRSTPRGGNIIDRAGCLTMADAVIAELGLFREFTWEGSTKLSRVVSKWVAE